MFGAQSLTVVTPHFLRSPSFPFVLLQSPEELYAVGVAEMATRLRALHGQVIFKGRVAWLPSRTSEGKCSRGHFAGEVPGGIAQLARAMALQAIGLGFKSPYLQFPE